MAFILTPRFAPVYQQQCSNPWSCAPARPQYSYRRVVRPAVPSFVPFLSQVDELLSALDQEAQREALREAHRQRQQRKRIFRAHFNVHENEEGYQVDGEVPGFEQSNIEIEVTDAHTLRVAGNTANKSETQPQSESHPTAEPKAIEPETAESTETAQDDTMEGVTLNEHESHSDTESHKSYQATVEDDFEDLGAETSSTISSRSNTPSEPKEPKGKEKAVDDSAATETAVQPQPQPETEEYQFHGSFERTFRFPERIDAATVKASLKNGLLSITVPKAKAPEVRRILIQ
ncbi:unnamed protein product [Periconia digitata]|uniref:SHSP domain-containing protein n=1 Tax=Periconia digitata TaxID=1303443 RepID=A0A9W4UMD3_9PLEO|nr:unnamed protein product [Periconia digitata]